MEKTNEMTTRQALEVLGKIQLEIPSHPHLAVCEDISQVQEAFKVLTKAIDELEKIKDNSIYLSDSERVNLESTLECPSELNDALKKLLGITVKGKEYEYGDDVGLFYYNGELIYKAGEIDSVNEDGCGEPIEEFGFEPDDEFEDMMGLYQKLLECWNDETKTYKYKNYELLILDI